jgi:subtilisin family serine protease
MLACLLGCVGAHPKTPAASIGPVAEGLDSTPEAWSTATQLLVARHRLRVVGNFPLSSIRVQCVVFQVPDERSLLDVIERLKADPLVESVQPNQVFEGLEAPRADSYAALSYGARAIRADVAHRVSTGKGVRVVLVDTGVDKDHPDLRGRVERIANFVEPGKSSFAGDRHGTAMAGVIAARAGDGVGISGIAPEAKLVSIKACWHPRGGGKALCSSWTLAKAIDLSINTGAQVLNLSLSGAPDPLLARLIAVAHERGMTIVAASAENGNGPGFPASLETVIAVLASDANGQVQLPAWKEQTLAIAAPGVDILTTAPQQGYDFLSGSSLAAAHVTGVVALLLEKKPRLSPSDMAKLIMTTAQHAPANAQPHPIGIVDACAALDELAGKPACPQ